MTEPSTRDWLPDLAIGAGVALLGVVEVAGQAAEWTAAPFVVLLFVAVTTGVAVGLSRRAPGAALALVWVACLLQVTNGLSVLLSQFAIAGVAFGTARWGRLPTVVASGVSIPLGPLFAIVFVPGRSLHALAGLSGFQNLISAGYQVSTSWQVAAGVVGTALLGLPWLAGLALRFGVRAQQSQASQVAAEADAARAVHETEQAREIARLREEQARLARDVHDVVGHSLAVILAQAESAQYLPDADTATLQEMMATIATSARSSLQDVRQVLSATQQPAGLRSRSGSLDSLIEGVRGSGHQVTSTVVGTPRPLPPDLEVVAFRVLQEMLTNAIKYGRREFTVWVERHWADDDVDGQLRIEVRNVIADGEAAGAGQGLVGMRRRLEAVGGRLDVRRRQEDPGPTFTATAWVPVRSGR